MQERSDQEIVLKIKNGEIEFFERIVKKYTQPIYSYLYKKVFNKSEIGDLVQNVFISFYHAIERFDEKRPILPYLYEIARNEMKMYLRSRKPTVSLDEAIYINTTKEENEINEDVEDLLKILDPDQRLALKMLHEGYSYYEIAKALNKPLNTIRTIIRRARLKLLKLKNEQT